MRELLKPFVMRYGSTRVEVAMEIRFEKKKKKENTLDCCSHTYNCLVLVLL